MLPKLSDALKRLGIEAQPRAISDGPEWIAGKGAELTVYSPIDGSRLAAFARATPDQLAAVVGHAHEAFLKWRTVPPPQRGQLVHRYGELLREHRESLAAIVAWEVGKITQEA